MNSSSHSWGTRVAFILAFFAVAVLAVVVTYERTRFRQAAERLARERSDLQAQLDARDLTVSQLKAEIRNLRSLVGAAPASRDPARPRNEAVLRQQLVELQASHSNTLALAGSLLAEKNSSVQTEETRKAREAVVAELESATSEAVQNAENARQKTEELLGSLNVPPNLETMDAETALASPSLRTYWPYFEAKKEQDMLARVVEALRLRLLQESADNTTETAPTGDSP